MLVSDSYEKRGKKLASLFTNKNSIHEEIKYRIKA
jgi:hypothetical protein